MSGAIEALKSKDDSFGGILPASKLAWIEDIDCATMGMTNLLIMATSPKSSIRALPISHQILKTGHQMKQVVL